MVQASSPDLFHVVKPYFDADERKLGRSGELWSLFVGLSLNSTAYFDVWSLISQDVVDGSNVPRRIGITAGTANEELEDEEAWATPQPLEGEYKTIFSSGGRMW